MESKNAVWLSRSFSNIIGFRDVGAMVAYMRSCNLDGWDFCEYLPDSTRLVQPYFDAEYEAPKARGARMEPDRGFLGYLLVVLRIRYPNERIVVMDSSGYTYKDRSRRTRAFKTSYRFIVHSRPTTVADLHRDVCRLNDLSDDRSLHFDTTCYTRKQHVRTIQSTKRPKEGRPPEPWRRFRYISTDGDSGFPAPRLEDTIIQTGIPAAGNGATVSRPPAAVARQALAQQGSRYAPGMPSDCRAALAALARACGAAADVETAAWDPHRMQDGRSPMIVLRSRSRECLVLQGEHKGNHILYNISRTHRAVFQSCWDLECRRSIKEMGKGKVCLGVKVGDIPDDLHRRIFYK